MPNSTLTVSAPLLPEGEPIRVPMGTNLTVTIDSAPDELVNYTLSLMPPQDNYYPSFRSINPAKADASHSHAYLEKTYHPAGEVTTFEFSTLNILPGTYQFSALVYDPYHRSSRRYILSNTFEIIEGISGEVLPLASRFDNIGQWIDAVVENITVTHPGVIGLYNIDGQPLDTVHTGQMAMLAINTNGMQEVYNQVFFTLNQDDAIPPFILFEISPFSRYVNPGELLALAGIPRGGLLHGVAYKIFYIPPHQTYTPQAGNLAVSLRSRKFADADELPEPPGFVPPQGNDNPIDVETAIRLTLTDDPVEQLQPNGRRLGRSGEPVPLQAQRVTIVTMGAEYPIEHFQAFAREIADYFNEATLNYFKLEIDVELLRLEDLDIDYAGWWNELPKDPDGQTLDPGDPNDLFYIRLIYAEENRLLTYLYLRDLRPPQANGEDITIYMYMTLGNGGGAMQNASEIVTHFDHKLMSDDYENDGVYKAPSEMNDPATVFNLPAKRAREANITTHELAHTFWLRPLRMSVGHANGYHMHENQKDGDRSYRFFKYLDSDTSRLGIGWGNTLMSYTRNRALLTQEMLADQLGPLLPMYGPPELDFLAKPVGAPMEEAVQEITINAGDSVEFVLQGSSPSGLKMMWYFEKDAQQVGQMYGYGHIDTYSRTYEAVETNVETFEQRGTYIYQANCRDILYYIPHGGIQSNAKTIGYPHQASENGGLREITIHVV